MRCSLFPLTLLLGALATVSGCATYSGQALPVDEALTSPDRSNWPTSGTTRFVLVARLPKDAEYVERVYGVNLLDHDVLPVEVYVQNRSASSSFQVRSERIRFVIPGATDETGLTRISAEEVQERVAFSQWRSAFAWLLIIPGIFSSMDIAAANQEMRNDYREKEFEDSFLPAAREGAARGEVAQGVIYFHPAGRQSLEEVDYGGGTLEVEVEHTPTSPDSPGERSFTATVNFVAGVR